jgi:transcriptional regulator with XRE-family HTH domain
LLKQESKIGKDIRKYRKKLSIYQDVLLKRVDIAYHINIIDTGSTPDPCIETVKKIADALGVTLDDLMK